MKAQPGWSCTHRRELTTKHVAHLTRRALLDQCGRQPESFVVHLLYSNGPSDDDDNETGTEACTG